MKYFKSDISVKFKTQFSYECLCLIVVYIDTCPFKYRWPPPVLPAHPRVALYRTLTLLALIFDGIFVFVSRTFGRRKAWLGHGRGTLTQSRSHSSKALQTLPFFSSTDIGDIFICRKNCLLFHKGKTQSLELNETSDIFIVFRKDGEILIKIPLRYSLRGDEEDATFCLRKCDYGFGG